MKDNKLIAEFMGYKTSNCITYRINDISLEPKEMQYHSSWDWLMPVVDKIRMLEIVEDFNINITCDVCIEGISNLSIHIYVEGNSTTLKTTYKAVVEFIKWHNKQEKVC